MELATYIPPGESSASSRDASAAPLDGDAGRTQLMAAMAANWNDAAAKYGAFFTFESVASKPKPIVGPSEHCAGVRAEKSTGFDIAVGENLLRSLFLNVYRDAAHPSPITLSIIPD
jgi:hypothetical protein